MKNFKNGFTLAEVLISMLLMSLFFMATTKVITQKPKAELQENPHGYFECYYSGGALFQHRSINNSNTPAENRTNAGNCEFVPPSGAAFINIYYIRRVRDENNNFIFQTINTQELQFNITQNFVPNNIQEEFAAKMTEEAGDNLPFRRYLQFAQPESNINEQWNNINLDSGVVFISW